MTKKELVVREVCDEEVLGFLMYHFNKSRKVPKTIEDVKVLICNPKTPREPKEPKRKMPSIRQVAEYLAELHDTTIQDVKIELIEMVNDAE